MITLKQINSRPSKKEKLGLERKAQRQCLKALRESLKEQELRPSPSISDELEDSYEIITKATPYAHLIEIKYLSSLECRVYRCKDHPESPEYYNLKGMIESHFKPFHK